MPDKFLNLNESLQCIWVGAIFWSHSMATFQGGTVWRNNPLKKPPGNSWSASHTGWHPPKRPFLSDNSAISKADVAPSAYPADHHLWESSAPPIFPLLSSSAFPEPLSHNKAYVFLINYELSTLNSQLLLFATLSLCSFATRLIFRPIVAKYTTL